jgi:hypothetical protein
MCDMRVHSKAEAFGGGMMRTEGDRWHLRCSNTTMRAHTGIGRPNKEGAL